MDAGIDAAGIAGGHQLSDEFLYRHRDLYAQLAGGGGGVGGSDYCGDGDPGGTAGKANGERKPGERVNYKADVQHHERGHDHAENVSLQYDSVKTVSSFKFRVSSGSGAVGA